MAISDKITSIQNHLKDDWDSVESLIGDTELDKNIENISSVLDDIYDSLPSVSGEGTSLTLDDTRVGKIKSTLKGNISQDGTPTPSSPIPVNVVSGDNEINVVGKNLLYLENGTKTDRGITGTISNDNVLTYSGTATQAYSNCTTEIPFILPNGTYTFSIDHATTNNERIVLYLSGGTSQTIVIQGGSTSNTFTLNGTNTSMIVGLTNLASGTSYSGTVKMQLEKNSTQTTYEPYQGNTYNIDLGMKNLWNSEDMKSGFLPQSGSYPITNPSYPNSIYVLVPLMAGQKLTLSGSTSYSGRVRCIDEDTNQVVNAFTTTDTEYYSTTHGFGDGFYEATITAKKYFIVGIMDYSGTNNNLIVNYGAKASAITDNPIELCKIGTYQDYFYKDSGKWYWQSYYLKQKLTGNEPWYQSGNGFWYYTVQYQNYLSKAENSDIMSNCFVRGRWNTTPSINTICQGNNGNGLIAISSNSFDSIESLTSFLSSNDVYVIGTRNTPTITEITYQPLIDQLNELEKAMSKDGQTNISQVNNDLPFIISASALKEWSV